MVAYCFSEGSGSTTADSSGNGHTGTLNNSPTWVTGKYGSGLRFDGDRSGLQNVTFGPNDALDALAQGTIMAWVKPANATATFSTWFQSGQNGQCSWPMELSVNVGRVEFWGGASGCSATLDASAPISGLVTDWHHLAYVVDATGNKFYVDGQLQAATYSQGNSSTQAFFAQTSSGVSMYRVGSSEWPPETFDGVIDEFRIYGTALTQTQIQTAMNVGYCGP